MSEQSRVLVALRVPATPERTFAAFTDDIGTWWRPNGLFQFTPNRTGSLAFQPGPRGCLIETYEDGTSFTVGDIITWDPPHRLVMTWRHASFAPDQATELHVTFRAVDAETRVVVEHFGWDRIPSDHVARHGFDLPVFQLRFAQWWQGQLGRLACAAAPGSSD